MALKRKDRKDLDPMKLWSFLLLFIFIFAQLAIIIDKPTWTEILIIEIIVVFSLVVLYLPFRWMMNDPENRKSRALNDIEKMEEKGQLEYENFEKPINSTAYSIGHPIFSFLWTYLLIVLVVDLQIIEPFPESLWTAGFFISLFIFVDFILIPAGIGKFRIDKIIVDPLNQTFIVRKNTLIFFYKKKQIFPWTDLKYVKVSSRWGDKLKFNFSDDFQSFFKPSRDDYLKIVPEAFRALIKGDHTSKLRALKALSMYDKKISRGRRICYSICISIAIIEIVLLIIF